MNGPDHGDCLTSTAAIPAEELRLLKAAKQRRQLGQGVSLLVYHRDGIRVVPLHLERGVIVGRREPADVAIRDNSLSRQHACFEIVNGDVWVEDMQSTNGTWLEGKRVDRCKLAPGATLLLGRVVVVVHSLEQFSGETFGVEGHDHFRWELELEVARSSAHNRPMSLIMVRCIAGTSSLSRWISTMRQWLRPYDRVGLYSMDTVEIISPETGVDDVVKLANKIVAQDTSSLRCGLAVFPHDGSSPDQLLDAARGHLQRASAGRPVASAQFGGLPAEDAEAPHIVVRSRAMVEVFDTCKKLADAVIPVLIEGETGTGKEVVARTIHQTGKRRDQSMICCNCGAIPQQLVESTLFGHEKGAFTGANQQAKGVFEAANGGTVLLDEIGELPAPAQVALLRVLETKRVTRIGSNKEIPIDVRVLAATHRNLLEMSRNLQFRQDLIFRLNAMTLRVPPLRDRPEEIAPLVEHFIQLANAANGCQVSGLEPQALDALQRYSWPGNIRELRNTVERAVVIAHDGMIGTEDLPASIRGLDPEHASAEGSQESAAVDAGEPCDEQLNLKTAVQRVEADLVLKALRASAWDRQAAAVRLGVSLRTLAYKMQQYGIRRAGYERTADGGGA